MHRAIQCDICNSFIHIKCINIISTQYMKLQVKQVKIGMVTCWIETLPFSLHQCQTTILIIYYQLKWMRVTSCQIIWVKIFLIDYITKLVMIICSIIWWKIVTTTWLKWQKFRPAKLTSCLCTNVRRASKISQL